MAYKSPTLELLRTWSTRTGFCVAIVPFNWQVGFEPNTVGGWFLSVGPFRFALIHGM
jgi:hypothetical protein